MALNKLSISAFVLLIAAPCLTFSFAQEAAVFSGPPGGTEHLVFSRSGNLLAANHGNSVVVWEFDGKKKVLHVKSNAVVGSIALSDDDKRLAIGDWDGVLAIWDVTTGKKLQTISNDSAVLSIAFAQHSDLLAFATGKTVKIWSALTQKVMETFTAKGDGVITVVTWSEDKKLLAAGQGGGDMVVWKVKEKEEVMFLGNQGLLTRMVFLPDQKRIAALAVYCDVKVYDLDKKALVAQLFPLRESGGINAMAHNPSRNEIAVGGTGTVVTLFDTSKLQRSGAFSAGDPVGALAYSPNGKSLAVGYSDFYGVSQTANDGRIRVFTIEELFKK
jgi:WD40 repeat protein